MKIYRIKNLVTFTYLFLGLLIIHSIFIINHRNTVVEYNKIYENKNITQAADEKSKLDTPENSPDVTGSNNIAIEKKNDLSRSNSIITFLEIILVLTGFPLLIIIGINIKNYRSKLSGLSKEIEESNKTYVFNSTDSVNIEDEEKVKSRLLDNLKKALFFIKSVSSGNYDIQWEGLNESNMESNRESIAGELIHMRDQMKLVKEKDEIRIWNTEGLSKFGEIIRNNQSNFNLLSEEIISRVVKYVDAQVGGLFILDKDEEGEESLHLKASYAYDRKKYLTKKIEVGEGIVGQCYLEGQTVYIEEVPQNYVSITSGLGLANPNSVLVIPLKANEKIEGILELASLKPFKPHQIEFLEKLGELLASSISTERTSEKTSELLKISQKQADEMRTQEEELRQNMEELQAIQETNQRTLDELANVTATLEKEKYLLDSLLNNMPDSIYFKDKESKFICVSKFLANRLNYTQEFLTGKSDFDLFDKTHAQAAFDDENHIMNTRQAKIDYVEQESEDQWVSTTKMPLINSAGEVVGTFGISRDVSKFKKLEIDIRAQEVKFNEETEQYKQKIKDLEEKIKLLEKEK